MEFDADHVRRIGFVGGLDIIESYPTVGRRSTFFVAIFTRTAGSFGACSSV
jgi:hypothetical protein